MRLWLLLEQNSPIQKKMIVLLNQCKAIKKRLKLPSSSNYYELKSHHPSIFVHLHLGKL